MDINEVKSFFEANKDNAEVRDYVKGFITPDRVINYLDGEEGKKLLQPRIDSHFTKGLETWKANNLQKMLDDHATKVITEKFPNETAEQKMIRELQQKFENAESQRIKESLKNKALGIATQKGLPLELVDYFVGQDESSTIESLTKLETVFNEALKNAVEGKFKDNGRKPQQGNTKTEIEQLEEQYDKATNTVQKIMLKQQIHNLKAKG